MLERAEPRGVIDALREEYGRGLAAALLYDPVTTYPILIASMLALFKASPLVIRLSGAVPVSPPAITDLKFDLDFPEMLKQVKSLGRGDLDRLAAYIAASAVDASSRARGTTNSYSKGVSEEGIAAVVEALHPDVLNEAMVGVFDGARYFADAPRKFCLAAVEETFGPKARVQAAKLKKAALAAHCLAEVAPKGWLPQELRTPGYSAPYSPPAAAQ
jgi:hypothetical protein